MPRSRNAAATRAILRCACAESGRRAEPDERDHVRRRARAGGALDVARSRAPPRPAGRRSRRPSRAARTPGRRRSRRRARRRASPTGSGGAGGGSDAARRSSIVSRGGRSRPRASRCGSTQQAAHSSLGGEHLEVQRRDHVEQHPVGEERPQLRRLGARRLGDLAHEVGVALAHPRLDLGVGGGRVALHLEQQRRAVGEQVRVGVAHRRHAALGRQRRAPPRRTSRRSARASTSWQARKSSRLVWKSRNRYGCEIPASRATWSVEVPL